MSPYRSGNLPPAPGVKIGLRPLPRFYTAILSFALLLLAGLSGCPAPKATSYGAAGGSQSPIIPISWMIPAWWIDPANVTVCAADTNNGQAASCSGGCVGATCPSGIGPLRTYRRLNDQLWECFGSPKLCPRLRQNTTINWLSGHTDDSDPVPFLASIENNSLVIHQGSITQVASVVLAGTVAKNRAAQQLLNTNLGASGAVGQLLINATHPSHALVYKSLGGNLFAISQPLNVGTLPGALPQNLSRPEVDTWADGDTVTLNTVPFINFVDIEPNIEDGGANGVGTNASLYLSQVGVFDPATKGDGLIVSQNVRGFDVIWQRSPHYNGLGNYVSTTGCANCWYQNGAGGYQDIAGTTNNNFTGGIMTTGTGQFFNGGSFVLDADLILNTAINSAAGRNIIGLVYADTGTQLALGSGDLLFTSLLGYAGGPKVWGPGPAGTFIQIQNGNHVTIPLGAGQCATTIATTTANLRFSGVAAGYVAIPTAGALGPFNVAFTCANVDANLGATQGCFTSGGGSALCNY